jgi:hypothetical protein
MEKTLRLLGLAAVVCTVAIVAAQQSAARKGGGSGQVGDSLATASKTPAALKENAVVHVMLRYFSGRQNYELNNAKARGREDLVDPIIRAACAGMLMVKTPEQQKYEIEQVWQTSKWVPNNPGWAAVCRTPSLVNELLKLDASALAKVEAFGDQRWTQLMKPYDDISDRIFAMPEYKAAKTQQERNVIHQKYYNPELAKIPQSVRSQRAMDADREIMDFAESTLTGAALAEFKKIRARADKVIDDAAAGKQIAAY